MNRRSSPLSLTVFLALACAAPLGAGCAGPPVPSPITGDPICADFTLGPTGTKMRGGLRNPVRVTVLDGGDVVTRVLIYGRHAESDPPPRLVLPDGNEEYTVEWGQCANERASAPLTGKPTEREAAGYDCGASPAYKTDKIVTKKGDRTPHPVAFAPPPKLDCWVDERPAEETADAGAPDASGEDAAALLADTDAGTAADAAADAEAPTDAGASDAAAPADAGDGGAAKTDKKPATDKTEKKAAPPAPAQAPEPTPAPAPKPTI